MATYHEHLKYHEDKVIKRDITNEEIEFLIELQREMNTQDHVSQADPRFWVIKGSEKVYHVEEPDGYELYDTDCCEVVASGTQAIVDYIRDNLLEDINENSGIEYKLSIYTGILDEAILVEWTVDDEEEREYLEDKNDIINWLDKFGIDRYDIISYKIIDKIYEDTMFLTQKAAENHLRSNHYHYSDDAHTYAMTSWRNYETLKLWKILQEVDWSKLK